MSSNFEFSKSNLDSIIKELAKEYRRLAGKHMPAELILVGGAAVLCSYGFRDMTTDIDAIIEASSVMKEAMNNVQDRLGLPNGWLNSDFKRTTSYTDKLYEVSKYYRTYSGILDVRVIKGEYLIAMKLVSGRKYKKDISDIIGILNEHYLKGEEISVDTILKAIQYIYGDGAVVDPADIELIEEAIEKADYQERYRRIRQDEIATKKKITEFDEQFPGAINSQNFKDIVNQLRNKKQ